jgi:pyridoxal phosphate enzyme (YggS family)
MGAFAERLAHVRARIDAACRRAGRDPAAVTLVAVSKTFPVAAIREAVAAGVTVFGESRIQEALPKMEALADVPGLAWHLVGHLQSNKAVKAVGTFALIHSVDTLALAERLDRLAAERGVVQDVLIEVNVAGEATKHGVAPGETEALVAAAAALSHLRVRGLMGMAPYSDDPEAARPHFRRLATLLREIAQNAPGGVTMDTLSMGMSDDFEVAIEEGATLVRIGTRLFGGRETT